MKQTIAHDLAPDLARRAAAAALAHFQARFPTSHITPDWLSPDEAVVAFTVIGLINEPTHGRVVIDGALVADEGWLPGLDLKRQRREKLGFIFQAHNLIPFLSAIENVMIALEINHLPRKEAKTRATELLTALNLGHRLNSYPSALSGGEAQRVAIARALAYKPRVILADEPTAALDTENGKNVMTLLKKLAIENRSAILVVTHDHRMVEGFDRIFHVSDGRIVGEDRNESPKAV